MTKPTRDDPPPPTFDDVLASLSADAITCRDLTHSWQPYRAAKLLRGYSRVLRCAICKTERHETLSAYGAVEKRHYVYPDGFLAPAGFGRLTSTHRDAIRLADLKATYGDDLSPRRNARRARKAS